MKLVLEFDDQEEAEEVIALMVKVKSFAEGLPNYEEKLRRVITRLELLTEEILFEREEVQGLQEESH